MKRWISRLIPKKSDGRGRPWSIPRDVVEKLRARFIASYRQWGARTLMHWAKRTGLGEYSAGAIARVISDLIPSLEPKPPTVRYEVTAADVMWSEDGTGFRTRCAKQELLVLQDECSRFKVNHRLSKGPAKAEDVIDYLSEAFERNGAPLVIKHDGGSIFHDKRVKELLERHKVLELTGPRSYPQYNGKNERSMRDIKGYVKAMGRYSFISSLGKRIDIAVEDLNEHRPRPVLVGHTAREVYTRTRMDLPDREQLMKEVDETERRLRNQAVSRNKRDSARRRAIEEVLLNHGLLIEEVNVSPNLAA